MTKVLLFAALVACIAVPFRVFVKGEQTKHRYKTTLALNGVMFFGLMLFTGVMMFSGNAFAAETAETAAVAASSTATGLGYCSRTFHRHVLYRWWNRRSECSKRSTWCNQ